MENDMTQSHEEHAKGILPIHKVVTVIDQKEGVDAALAALAEVGIADDDIMVHHGAEAVTYFDLEGEHSSKLRNLVRRYQRLQGIEKKMLDDVEIGLKNGSYMIGVDTHGKEDLQMPIVDALKPSTKHHIYYCGRFTISILEFAE